MKNTIVSPGGSVRCPVCNGSQFTLKRTAKAKWGAGLAGALTFGVGGAIAIAAMPKRVYCLGCGENLKTGGANQVSEDGPWRNIPGIELQAGDEFEKMGKMWTVLSVEGGKILTDKGNLGKANTLKFKVRRDEW